MSLFIYLTIYMYLLSFVKFLYILFLIISFTNQYILFRLSFHYKIVLIIVVTNYTYVSQNK